MRLCALLALCVAVWSAVACGGDDGGPASGDGDGSLIIANGTAIVERPVAGGSENTLITPAVLNSFLLDPALSPDGSRLAYIVQPPAKVVDGRYDAGSDLWIANRDGSEPRPLFEHVDPNQLVRFPRWQDDTHLLAIVQEIVIEGGVSDVAYTLQRIDTASGARETLFEDVVSYTVSPDGRRIVFSRITPEGVETLLAADADGGNSDTLVPPSASLAPFQSPDYSPDGASIAFAAAEQPQAASRARYAISRPLAQPGRPRLNGLPEDIWTVDAAGGPPKRVADLKEDLPALTWDGDGDHIYVLGAAGLYDVDVRTGKTSRIGEGVFHGQVTWAP